MVIFTRHVDLAIEQIEQWAAISDADLECYHKWSLMFGYFSFYKRISRRTPGVDREKSPFWDEMIKCYIASTNSC